jgi:hypothetical protein
VLVFFKEMVGPLDLAKLTIVFIGKGDLQHLLMLKVIGIYRSGHKGNSPDHRNSSIGLYPLG